MIVVSCSDKRERNYQYFPDMYESVPYDTYGAYDIFQDEQEAKIPEEGSISRGFTPYEYDDDPDGYALAKAELKNEVPYTEENLAKGKELYAIYCATCHGDNGKGKGYLVEREKILGVPSYDDQGRAITEGSVYHVMWHGINTMGSYASQMDSEELWLVDHYVMKLKAELEGQEPREFESESE
jgi:mono/diheme cytochrome c family protein